MSFWTAIVVIAAIIGFVSLYKAKHGIISDNAGNDQYIGQRDSAAEERAQPEIAELRERIKVLERIATDKNSEAERLARKIEDLRED